MALAPPDSAYITAPVPPEMRDGLDGTEVAPPTAGIDTDGTPTTITRIHAPRPTHIPPPSAFRIAEAPLPMPQPVAGTLQFAFALLPGVQCHLTLTGPAGADHLEQLCEYLTVACRRIREQEKQDGAKSKGRQAGKAPKEEA